ncbi:AAC(3) family N-acetyltransferase [Bacillus haimaensis]|uniref:aminoglycoside N(3)-acetyltransferase n=1 Tax=Bacillus haimaensis TaxID=3160967 RepID=UPI003AA9924A
MTQHEEEISSTLVTKSSLIDDLRKLGIKEGQTLLVHSSLSKIGWVCGAQVAVIQALQEVLTDKGTLVMPTHTGDNSDPSEWQHPPVPSEWWETIKVETPAFDPDITPTYKMGVVPESFRSFPNVVRSNHPTLSFAAWGQHKHFVTDGHGLDEGLGEHSPLARIYDLKGSVLLLGVDYENNTSMHLAEHRQPEKTLIKAGSAIMEDGAKVWKEYHTIAYQDEVFNEIGKKFELKFEVKQGYIGKAFSRLMDQKELVDYTYEYFLNLSTSKE